MKLMLSFYFILCGFTGFSQLPSKIEYATDGPFHWSMFKGKVNPAMRTGSGKNIGAVTVSSLSYQTFDINAVSAKVKIVALFHTDESWTKYPKITKPEESLIHEKRHFDICEIYARKIRQIVSQTTFYLRSFNKDLDSIFTKLANEFQAEQVRYDHETAHSIHEENQLKWNAMIDARLDALSDYADSEVKVTFR